MAYGRNRQFGQDDSTAATPPSGTQASPSQLTIQDPLLANYRNLKIQVAQLKAANKARQDMVNQQKMITNQGIERTTGPDAIERNFKSMLPSYLVPGNLGDINKVIWPFWFTATTQEVPEASGGTMSQATGAFTVTQEAAFVLMCYTKSVFVRAPADPNVAFTSYSYLDPTLDQDAPGLSFAFNDAQSRRMFMNRPIEFDHVGDPRFPSVLPSPMLLLPNSTIEIQYYNTNPTVTYVPWLTFFGYRVRIEDAQRILSLVSR